MLVFFTFDNITERNEFLDFLSSEYPKHCQQPERLNEIMELFKQFGVVTAIVETEYSDKQYRDSYYLYFAQKFSNYERNCIRLAFFEGHLCPDAFEAADLKQTEIENKFIGIVVLRPLNIGMVGKTLLNPKKLEINGYVQTCDYKTTIAGRKLTIPTFPFSSQDAETMTCAETSLYNLALYYGRKYPDYRMLMPTEILHHVEDTYYERVLPSTGVHEESLTKVLSNTNFHPRLYTDIENFQDILHMYVESGIPFILGLPKHVVNCIGHGRVDTCMDSHSLADVVYQCENNAEQLTHYLSVSSLVDEYIIMDDNKAPYHLASISDITAEYNLKETLEEDEQEASCVVADIGKKDSLIVPLYRRVYIDAPRAKEVFEHLFLKDSFFISSIREAYADLEWGAKIEHPLVWRMYLTTANKYRDFKIITAHSSSLANHYMANSFPHFIWVLEIGTLENLKSGVARVEVLLDASASKYSEFWGILSVGYKNHFVFVPNVMNEEIGEEIKVTDKTSADESGEIKSISSEKKIIKKPLTRVFELLYNSSTEFFSDDFMIFRNLEEV